MTEVTPDNAARATPVAWRIRIGASDTWGYTGDEMQADFYGKQSGLPYVKEAMYPAATVAALEAEVEVWRSQCDGLNESRKEEESRADTAERRVAELEVAAFAARGRLIYLNSLYGEKIDADIIDKINANLTGARAK